MLVVEPSYIFLSSALPTPMLPQRFLLRIGRHGAAAAPLPIAVVDITTAAAAAAVVAVVAVVAIVAIVAVIAAIAPLGSTASKSWLYK